MPTKSANNAIELSYINFIASNNTVNFTATPISNGAPIADATAGVYANGAFAKANSALSNTNLNVSGTLRMLNQGGSEGGELFLDKPSSNTSLAAGITLDIFENKLRIFETGGGIRGAFIDIANTTANGVGSEIVKYDANNSSTGFFTLPIGTLAQRPANPARGTMRYNSSNNVVEVYMPTAGWVNVAQDTFTLEYLIVAGGGGGGTWAGGGGGGAGGVLYSATLNTPVSVSYTVTVGGGGSAGASSPNGPNGQPGSNSSIVAASTGVSLIAVGGGAGGGAQAPGGLQSGQPGGSGGGNGGGSGTVGSGTLGQGNPGGAYGVGQAWGGGGGGAGAPGSAATTGGGPGGIGVTYAAFNTFSPSGYFGGGGGGAAHTSGTTGTGGTGGGGSGFYDVNAQAPSGLTNSGGGGGGAGGRSPSYGVASGGGGSGIVIIRYAGTTQRATGGTITTGSGYTYHTFTGSGTFNFTG